MKSEDAAKMSDYTGPINVMTVREVSAYLRVHSSTIGLTEGSSLPEGFAKSSR